MTFLSLFQTCLERETTLSAIVWLLKSTKSFFEDGAVFLGLTMDIYFPHFTKRSTHLMLIFYRLPFATSTLMLPFIRTCEFSWATTDWVSKEFHLVSTLDWEKQSLWAFFFTSSLFITFSTSMPRSTRPCKRKTGECRLWKLIRQHLPLDV